MACIHIECLLLMASWSGLNLMLDKSCDSFDRNHVGIRLFQCLDAWVLKHFFFAFSFSTLYFEFHDFLDKNNIMNLIFFLVSFWSHLTLCLAARPWYPGIVQSIDWQDSAVWVYLYVAPIYLVIYSFLFHDSWFVLLCYFLWTKLERTLHS